MEREEEVDDMYNSIRRNAAGGRAAAPGDHGLEQKDRVARGAHCLMWEEHLNPTRVPASTYLRLLFMYSLLLPDFEIDFYFIGLT